MAERLEVRGLIAREDRGASLAHPRARDVASVAKNARALLAQTPEAHALDSERLRVELDDVADRGTPFAVGRARELQEQPRPAALGAQHDAPSRASAKTRLCLPPRSRRSRPRQGSMSTICDCVCAEQGARRGREAQPWRRAVEPSRGPQQDVGDDEIGDEEDRDGAGDGKAHGRRWAGAARGRTRVRTQSVRASSPGGSTRHRRVPRRAAS